MVRMRVKRKAGAYAVLNFPLMVPEIVTAIATLIFFSSIGLGLGFPALVIAHTTFCIPFAYLPIAARLISMDPALRGRRRRPLRPAVAAICVDHAATPGPRPDLGLAFGLHRQP